MLRSTLSLEEVPAYTNQDFIAVNDGIPDFYIWQLSTEAYVIFSDLDELGRTGPAIACLGPETVSTEERQPMGNDYPTGWQNTEYPDLIEDSHLYDRSHLIAYMLCGDNGTPENIFTGTRYLNRGSMLLWEKKVADYIGRTDNHVLYRVTPVFHERDLVPTGVQMEAFSLEDGGQGVCFNVFVYNVQPGVRIDYASGNSSADQDFLLQVEAAAGGLLALEELTPTDSAEIVREAPVVDPAVAEAQTTADTSEAGSHYVLNKNTKKFHYPWCSSADEIKPKNREDFYGSREEVLEKNYMPCKRCNP